MELTHSADYLLYEQAECIAAYLGASFMAEKVTGIERQGRRIVYPFFSKIPSVEKNVSESHRFTFSFLIIDQVFDLTGQLSDMTQDIDESYLHVFLIISSFHGFRLHRVRTYDYPTKQLLFVRFFLAVTESHLGNFYLCSDLSCVPSSQPLIDHQRQ